MAKRLIVSEDPSTILTIVVTSRTLPGVRECIRTLKAFAMKLQREAIVEFDYLMFDQTSMISMLGAARELKERYPHIDCLILNSSYVHSTKIDYWKATKDFFKDPIMVFTAAKIRIQSIGTKSRDGLGISFQANVFSPWFLINEIIENLSNGGKIIWITSCISYQECLFPDDLQLLKSPESYEASKREIDLLHHATYKELYDKFGIQSFLVQPGIFKSTTYVPTLNFISYWIMMLMLYVCRWSGSGYHNIDPNIAANAPVWLATEADYKKGDRLDIKYGSSCTKTGRELIKTEELEAEGAQAVRDYVEDLRLEWKDKLKDQVVDRYLY